MSFFNFAGVARVRRSYRGRRCTQRCGGTRWAKRRGRRHCDDPEFAKILVFVVIRLASFKVGCSYSYKLCIREIIMQRYKRGHTNLNLLYAYRAIVLCILSWRLLLRHQRLPALNYIVPVEITSSWLIYNFDYDNILGQIIVLDILKQCCYQNFVEPLKAIYFLIFYKI